MAEKTEKKHSKKTKKSKDANSGPPEIPFQDINFNPKSDYIGEGAFGKVYRAKIAGKYCAVKFPIRSTLSESELKTFRNEVAIMKKIYHPNVVLFLGACTEPGHIGIVTELLKGDLEKILETRDKKNYPVLKRMHWAKDAALGMNWLHTICNIIHRDLKPANLLIDENGRVKVTDFGFSRSLRSGENLIDVRGPKGTALYMAPEVLMQQEFNTSIDIYAFGLILWELYTMKELFSEFEDLEPFVEAVCFDHHRPPVDKDCPLELRELMEKCWAQDKDERPTFEVVCAKLDLILIEMQLKLQSCRQFWKVHFLEETKELREVVNYPDLVKVIQKSAGVDDLKTGNLSAFLRDDAGKTTIESYDVLTRWFGPIHEDKELLTQCNRILGNVLKKKGWFHGDISKEEAERRLQNSGAKSFLIRASRNSPDDFPFTVARKGSDGGIRHVRIKRIGYNSKEAQFSFSLLNEEIEFLSLADLVTAIQKKGWVESEAVHEVAGSAYEQNADED